MPEVSQYLISLHYRVPVTQTDSLIVSQSRHMGKWNRREGPEIKPHTHNHQFFTKFSKLYIGEKKASFIFEAVEIHVEE